MSSKMSEKESDVEIPVLERETDLTWNGLYMGIADLASRRSKDDRTQVGACLVSSKKKLMGIGYNSHPVVKEGINKHKEYPWRKKEKQRFVCHAEMNAIAFSSGPLEGATMFVTLHPCNECAKLIVQAGIAKVVYKDSKKKEDQREEDAKKIFSLSNTKFEKFSDIE